MKLDRVRLISHDMGSITGFALCLDHPERVERHLALSVPPPFLKLHPRLLPGMRHLWFQQALAIPRLGARLVREKRQWLPRYLFTEAAADQDAWSSEVIDTYIAQFREPGHARAASALYRQLVLPEEGRMVRGTYRKVRLRTPTLLIFGAADSAFPPSLVDLVVRGRKAYADHVEVAFVEGAGHFIVDERPPAVVDHALTFFQLTTGLEADPV